MLLSHRKSLCALAGDEGQSLLYGVRPVCPSATYGFDVTLSLSSLYTVLPEYSLVAIFVELSARASYIQSSGLYLPPAIVYLGCSQAPIASSIAIPNTAEFATVYEDKQHLPLYPRN